MGEILRPEVYLPPPEEVTQILQHQREDGTFEQRLFSKALNVPSGAIPYCAAVARRLANEILPAWHDAPGQRTVAIAFPQLGVPLRAFLMYPRGIPTSGVLCLNPAWVPDHSYRPPPPMKEPRYIPEGCASVKACGDWRPVSRYHSITWNYISVRRWWARGKEKPQLYSNQGAFGLDAQIVQHECDHLDGVLLGGIGR